MKSTYTAYTAIIIMALSCANGNQSAEQKSSDNSFPALTQESKKLPLEKLKLPAGFKIEVYAEVQDARSMALSPSGVLYVGNRDKDKVYAVKDTDGDFKADKKWIVASGLNSPNGVAFKDGDLYIAEINKITKLPKIESNLAAPPKPVVINDEYPTEGHHGWKYIAFGPDGKLYVPVGAPCNICESKDEIFASITRVNADGSGREVFVHGVRNTVGFTWHPETKELWFTDNGRDMLGDDTPSCELNVASKKGQHFGYPYCHEGAIKDPEFGSKRACNEFVSPVDKLGPHVAPLGLKFYTGKQFPTQYKNQVFVAEHGSWNRSKKIGYNVTLVKVANNKVSGHEKFIEGWLDDATQKSWGRPVDVLLLPDGSMLISDDQANVIYRVSYKG
ncbi:PQQ-dependent sugar dehydrogenase [Pseudochryseolinea flava]|uniref:Sorbosone dehydrogenase family protein n=1 Tax=Pseudochryseolinea flava TaxID=2059302 RepID=A0A364Y0F0_9BACT|nr:PQQ-dependent sugar dehydrogenase [Pseudochryseolinea flava]RAV99564.1 sorbosone dehydrogenase family protein [Pseudochryseolinea flava]